MRKPLSIIIWFLALGILVSCTPTANNNVEDNMAIAEMSETPTQIIATPSLTATKVTIEETKTTTSIPPTESAMPQPTATVTPIVTPATIRYSPSDVVVSNLTEGQATQKLIELLETNDNCQLPCWWGIQLGKTEVDMIETTFVPLGFDWYPFFEDLRDNAIYKASVSLMSEDGIVQSIQVWGGAGEETYDQNEAWRPYAIPNILAQYGVPDEVYVFYPFRFDPGGSQAYRLFMYYPDLGIEIDYLGLASLVPDRSGWAQAYHNILRTDEINLFLFQPGTVPDYLEQSLPESSLPLPKLPEGAKPYDVVSWEHATESSIVDFEQLFLNSEEGEVCFEFKTYWTGNDE